MGRDKMGDDFCDYEHGLERSFLRCFQGNRDIAD